MKKQEFLSKMQEGKYDVLYFEANHFYYDLVSLYNEEKFELFTIPAPLLVEGEKDDPDMYEGDVFYDSTMREFVILNVLDVSYEDVEYKDRDDYQEFREEIDIMQNDKKELKKLSTYERTLLSEGVDIVTDYIENQYGKKVISSCIFGSIQQGFYEKTLVCASSESLGLGTCQCVNHDPYDVSRIGIKDVLDVLKEKQEI